MDNIKFYETFIGLQKVCIDNKRNKFLFCAVFLIQ